MSADRSEQGRGNDGAAGANRLEPIVAGAVAGVVATAVMSPLMAPRLTRLSPGGGKLEMFPPRRVVRQLERVIVGKDRLPASTERWLTLGAHVGYGCAMGATYGLLRDRFPHGPPGVAGVAFGLAIWSVSYAGWMPVLGVREGTVAGRRRSMPFPLAAHVAFGLSLGWMHGRFVGRGSS